MSAPHHIHYTFFWKSHSPFSQWHPCSFVVKGVHFNCAEQYMMYRKALTFKDADIAAQVLSQFSPKIQKALGRKVRRFDADIWEQQREQVVYEGNLAKFDQNPHLRHALFETGDTQLVEASPVDCIWGIGLTADHPDACHPDKWRGQNLLGKILTRVRDDLRRTEQ